MFSAERAVTIGAFEIVILVMGRTVVHVLIVAVCSIEPPLAWIAVVRHFDRSSLKRIKFFAPRRDDWERGI